MADRRLATPRLFKRRGELREKTEALLSQVGEEIDERELELEALKKEEVILKKKLEELD